MRKLALLAVPILLTLSLGGCGGQLGRDSPVQARLETSTHTVQFPNLHIIISPNSGTATSSSAASDIQGQSWVTIIGSQSFKELDFTTNSQQIPYFVYLQNTDAVQEEARIRIFMDGIEKYNQVLVIPANTTVQETTIFRNNTG